MLLCISAEIIVNQIYPNLETLVVFLAGLMEEETAAYLRHRLVAAGYAGERLFDVSALKKIHRPTGGFPGP